MNMGKLMMEKQYITTILDDSDNLRIREQKETSKKNMIKKL